MTMIAVLLLMVWYSAWFGNAVINHGKEYTVGPLLMIFSYMITIICLVVGGFFNAWHWPQFVYVITCGLGLGVWFGSGGKLTSKHNMGTSLVVYALMVFLYYKGGLFACFVNP